MRVLGIDPSLKSTGFGIIESRGGSYRPLAFGIIKPKPGLSLPGKLNDIRTEIESLIGSFHPDEVVVENPFLARNVKTAMLLGQVRGAVLVAVAARGLDLYEYSALEIKRAVTGYGQADKEQVQIMVRMLLALEDDRIPQDASDALAAAVCHFNARHLHIKIEEEEDTP